MQMSGLGKDDVFVMQLAAMLAMDGGRITVTKRGATYVLESGKNKATIPDSMAPMVNSYYQRYKIELQDVRRPRKKS